MVLTRQLILDSMIFFSSFQFNLNLADKGMGEMAYVGEVLGRERGLSLAEIASISL